MTNVHNHEWLQGTNDALGLLVTRVYIVLEWMATDHIAIYLVSVHIPQWTRTQNEYVLRVPVDRSPAPHW